MSNPTFNDIDLVALAGRTQLGSRQSRAITETMPGVDGLFVQPLGAAGRRIEVSGLLYETAFTPADARANALAAFRQREVLADGRTIADFIDADGASYANCMVMRVSHGPMRIVRPVAGVFAAYLPVTIELLQLTP
jgi:hypothetical protein